MVLSRNVLIVGLSLEITHAIVCSNGTVIIMGFFPSNHNLKILIRWQTKMVSMVTLHCCYAMSYRCSIELPVLEPKEW